MHLTEMGCEDVNWIYLAQDRIQWQALVNTVMKLQIKCFLTEYHSVLGSGGIAPRTLDLGTGCR